MEGIASKERGFVTMATGSIEYYMMAYNLLLSYRRLSPSPMPFAIMCDRTNRYTDAFDDAVIIEHPSNSFMDKMLLLEISPYKENIFVEADCIAYRDLNLLWDYFKDSPAFRAFGVAYPLDAHDFVHCRPWFTADVSKVFGDRIKYLLYQHGGVYYIRNDGELPAFRETSTYIVDNYGSFNFQLFKEPCDEPVLALACAVHDYRPVEDPFKVICFYPTAPAEDFQDVIKANTQGILMVHWSSRDTRGPDYRREVRKLAWKCGLKEYLQACYRCFRVAFPIFRKQAVYDIKAFTYKVLTSITGRRKYN